MRKSKRALATLLAVGAIALAGCSDSGGTTGAPVDGGGSSAGTPTAGGTVAAASAASVASAVAASTSIKKVPTGMTPSLVRAAADRTTDRCRAGQKETSAAICAFGDTTSATTVILYGDSHAGMWVPAINLAAKAAGVRIVVLEKSACPPPDLKFWDFEDRRANTECDAWHTWAVKQIKRLHPVLTVVTSFTYHPVDDHDAAIGPAKYFAGLKRTMTMVAAGSTKVVYLGDIHYLTQIAANCLAAHQDDVQSCSTPTSKAQTSVTAYINAHAADLGAPIIDPTPWLCTSSACSPVIGKYLVYRDQYHISDTYSAYLSGVLGAELVPLGLAR